MGAVKNGLEHGHLSGLLYDSRDVELGECVLVDVGCGADHRHGQVDPGDAQLPFLGELLQISFVLRPGLVRQRPVVAEGI